MFSFRGQFDHRFLPYGLDGNSSGHGDAAILQLQHALPSTPDFLAQFSLCGFETAHRPALVFQIGQRLQTVLGLQSI